MTLKKQSQFRPGLKNSEVIAKLSIFFLQDFKKRKCIIDFLTVLLEMARTIYQHTKIMLQLFIIAQESITKQIISLNSRTKPKSGMKKLVFIIEDDLVQQKMLQVHFEDMLQHLKEKPFAVVLDHFFSDENGKTGLDYLRIMRKGYSSIPVIYYTTLEDESIRAEVMSLGAEQYIIKNSASLVRLRSALDNLHEKESKKGFLKKLFN